MVGPRLLRLVQFLPATVKIVEGIWAGRGVVSPVG